MPVLPGNRSAVLPWTTFFWLATFGLASWLCVCDGGGVEKEVLGGDVYNGNPTIGLSETLARLAQPAPRRKKHRYLAGRDRLADGNLDKTNQARHGWAGAAPAYSRFLCQKYGCFLSRSRELQSNIAFWKLDLLWVTWFLALVSSMWVGVRYQLTRVRHRNVIGPPYSLVYKKLGSIFRNQEAIIYDR